MEAYIRNKLVDALLVLLLVESVEAFAPQCYARRSTCQRLSPVDLSEGIQSLSSIGHFDHSHMTQQLDSVLSTMYTMPAHGHTQPMFGAPDPFLSAGKSIAPSVKSLSDMGITKSAQGLTEQAQAAAAKGWSILDSAAITAEDVLPGFTPTGGFLPGHNPRMAAETPETFAAQVQWSANFLNIFDKLPSTAFAYALVEFFLLRPGIDLYKEDIELEPGTALAETVVTTGVRVGVFLVLAVVTTGLFG